MTLFSKTESGILLPWLPTCVIVSCYMIVVVNCLLFTDTVLSVPSHGYLTMLMFAIYYK